MKPLILFGLIMLPVIGFSQVKDSARVVWEVDSLVLVADSLRQEEKFTEAIAITESARDLANKNLGEEHEKYALCLYFLGICNFQLGHYEVAEQLYLEAKTIREKVLGKAHPDYAKCLNNLAILYSEMGQYKKAIPLLLETKVVWEKSIGKEHPHYAATLTNIAIFYKNMGQYGAADTLLLEVKSIRRKVYGTEHPEYAASLNNLAVVYQDLGRYEDAERLNLEVLTIWEKTLGKEHSNYARGLSNLGNLYRDMGRYEAAELYLLEAKIILENVFGNNHPEYTLILYNLGALYEDMGGYEVAEGFYLEAKAIEEKVLDKESHEYAANLSNLGSLYLKMKYYDAAEQRLLEAIAIQRIVFGKEHPDYAKSLYYLGILNEDMGRYETAELHLLEAKTIEELVLGKEHPYYAETLNSLGNLNKNMGRYEVAEQFHLEAKANQEKALGKEHPDYAKSLTNLMVLYWEMQRYETARPFLKEANSIQRKLITQSSRHLSEQELAAYIKLFVQNLNWSSSFAQATPGGTELSTVIFDNALFHKGFLLTAINQVKHLALVDTTSKKQFNLLTSYHRRLATEYALPIAERDSAIVASLEEKANTLEKELVRRVSGFSEALRQVTSRDVQEKLKPDEAAIEFIQYQFSNPKPTDSIFYSALVLRSGDKAPLFVPLFEEREIAALLETAKGGNFRDINALYLSVGKESLYGLIWKPLEESLMGASTVYFSPSGLLHRLNLGAIPTSEKESFSDKYQLIRMGSTRQLVVPNFTKIVGNSAYVVGGVRYEMDSTAIAVSNENNGNTTRGMMASDGLPFTVDSTLRGDPWKYLPGSATEAVEISKILKSANFAVELDTGYAATEESFKRMGNKQTSPRIVLASTHGFFFPDPAPQGGGPDSPLGATGVPVFKISEHPMIRSGLVLAGANHAWETSKPLRPDMDDGILTAYEISQMNLSNTELVVLSACETGLGDIEGNEGVYGLQRAFKIAGAKYLVMSLWKVNDQSTSEFMTAFYSQWLEKGLAIPEAFRTAQKAMKAKYKDPYHWAGFVLVE